MTLPNDQLATNIENLGNLYLLQSILTNIGSNLALIAEGATGMVVNLVNPNLYALAAQYYGDASQWTTIAKANGISDPIFTGGQVISVQVTNGGSGYVNPTVDFFGDELNPANVTVDVTDGVITAVNIQNGGLYGTLPTVGFNDPAGTGATATAMCSATLIIPQTSTPSGGLLNPSN